MDLVVHVLHPVNQYCHFNVTAVRTNMCNRKRGGGGVGVGAELVVWGQGDACCHVHWYT